MGSPKLRAKGAASDPREETGYGKGHVLEREKYAKLIPGARSHVIWERWGCSLNYWREFSSFAESGMDQEGGLGKKRGTPYVPTAN